MIPSRSLLERARHSLLALAGVMALCTLLIAGSHYWNAHTHEELARTQSALALRQAELLEKQADLLNIQTHIEQFHYLTELGLIGTPDREAWVQQLLASHSRTGLPEPLGYTLHAPKPASTPTVSGATPMANGDGPQVHDLEFSLTRVHEEDLLALLQDFALRARGRFRVNACTLSEPTPAGLAATCGLRFFTLPQNSAGPAAVQGQHGPQRQQVRRSIGNAEYFPRLGTLLYSPAERSSMAQQRLGLAPDEGGTLLHVSGVVTRARTNSTAWINRHAVAQGQTLAPTKHTRISATGVTLDGRRVRVGETLDLANGERADLVSPGAVTVRTAK